MRRVLVTGGLGFVGSHLVVRLVGEDDHVTVLDTLPSGRRDRTTTVLGDTNHRYVVGDVRDAAAVRDEVEQADLVYHLASHVGIDEYLSSGVEVADTIYLGTKTVAAACIAADVPLVFLSTSEAYGKNPSLPWDEHADAVLGDPTKTRWIYAVAKILAEHLLFAEAERGLRFATARLFNLYGPGQGAGFFVTRTLSRLAVGKPAVVFDGGRQRRCFTFIDDAIDALVAIGRMHDSVRGLAMNVGSDRPLSVLEAIGEIAGSLGMSPERVTYEFVSSKDVYGENYEEPLTRIPEIGLARGKLGWSPDTDLRTGCTNMLAFAAEHGWWIRDGEA